MEIASKRVRPGLALCKKRDLPTVTYIYNEHSHPIHPFRSERRHFNLSAHQKVFAVDWISQFTCHSLHITNSISVRVGGRIARLRNNRNYTALHKRKINPQSKRKFVMRTRFISYLARSTSVVGLRETGNESVKGATWLYREFPLRPSLSRWPSVSAHLQIPDA